MYDKRELEKARKAKEKLKEKIAYLGCSVGIGKKDDGSDELILTVRIKK